MTIDAYAVAIAGARDTFMALQAGIREKHPTWTLADARVFAFARCANVLHSAFLFLLCQRHILPRHDFWMAFFERPPTKDEFATYQREAEVFVAFGAFHGVFSGVEATLRIFLRTIDPEVAKGASTDFKSVYDALFARLDLKELAPLLDLLRLVRNVIHNNGVFISTHGKDETVRYDGHIYFFMHGQSVDFVSWGYKSGWEFILPKLKRVAEALQAIVLRSPLVDEGHIPDPSL